METNKTIRYSIIGCLSACALFFLLFVIIPVFGFFYFGGSDSEKNRTFDVQTKTGIVQLHLGMPKDSVILLLGKPDNKSASSIGNTINEELDYYSTDDATETLYLRFENGTLESFSQY